ncbi:MAG: hypothetical protein IJM32_04080 [Ruminococcus sp.]|nr:hypothetical protein [Ruminococcus sp.]
MLEKYEYLIYHSEEEKAATQKSYGNYDEQVWNEDKRLFDMTAEKHGNSLWAGLAWKAANCKERCPFGDGCENDRIIIDDTEYCMGQIYYNNYSLNDLLDMIKHSKTAYLTNHCDFKRKLCNNINKQCTHSPKCYDCGADYLPEILDKIYYYFYFFGDVYKNEKNEVYGENVISLLEQDNSHL